MLGTWLGWFLANSSKRKMEENRRRGRPPMRNRHASIQNKPKITFEDLLRVLRGRGGKKSAGEFFRSHKYSEAQVTRHVNRLIEEVTRDVELVFTGKSHKNSLTCKSNTLREILFRFCASSWRAFQRVRHSRSSGMAVLAKRDFKECSSHRFQQRMRTRHEIITSSDGAA